MIIHWERDGQQYEGELEDSVYRDELFAIFAKHLKPVAEKKFYTLDQAKTKLALSGNRKRGWLV